MLSSIDPLLIVLIAALVVFVLLPLLGFARMAWRIWRHNEEMQPGGSIGRQLFGSTADTETRRRDQD